LRWIRSETAASRSSCRTARRLPEIRKVTLDRLYAAGLTSLSMYYVAKRMIWWKLRESASTWPIASCAFSSSTAEQSGSGRKLNVLSNGNASRRSPPSWVTRRAFEEERAGDPGDQATSAESEDRNATMVELEVVLARAGAVDLVQRLERLPFQQSWRSSAGTSNGCGCMQAPPPSAPAHSPKG